MTDHPFFVASEGSARTPTPTKQCVLALALAAAAILSPETAQADDAKSVGEPMSHERLFLELGVGINGARKTAYIERLEQFGFESDYSSEGLVSDASPSVATAVMGWMLTEHLGGLLRYEGLERRSYYRNLSGPSGNSRDETFAWATRAVSLGLRARLPLAGEWVSLYGEADVGLGIGSTSMTGEDVDHSERYFGLTLGGRAGVQAHASRSFGFFLEAGYTYAPVIDNLVGETHDDGGVVIATGIRVRTLGGTW